MKTRRWKDPRSRRVWEVTVTPVARCGAPAEGGDGRRPRRKIAVCFDSTATPRQELVACGCDRLEEALERLSDQELALCLEAARDGAFLWVHPRDGELWYVLRDEEPGAAGSRWTVRFRSSRGDLPAPVSVDEPLDGLPAPLLLALLDDARQGRSEVATRSPEAESTPDAA